MKRYWLIKTEPTTYSFQDLQNDEVTYWDGVRNYQARNYLKSMAKGDLAFVYHSVGPKEVYGIAEVIRTFYADPTDRTGQWVVVDVKARSALRRPVSLEDFKANKILRNTPLIRQSRLSVMPISNIQAKQISKLGGL